MADYFLKTLKSSKEISKSPTTKKIAGYKRV
jgi:hypothetical protein